MRVLVVRNTYLVTRVKYLLPCLQVPPIYSTDSSRSIPHCLDLRVDSDRFRLPTPKSNRNEVLRSYPFYIQVPTLKVLLHQVRRDSPSLKVSIHVIPDCRKTRHFFRLGSKEDKPLRPIRVESNLYRPDLTPTPPTSPLTLPGLDQKSLNSPIR